jgi:glycosyltransferase involved in cell wall biosynthesis
MPAYNEEEHIEASVRAVHTALEQLGYQHEIIVVDDGSKDKTRSIAAQLAQQLSLRVIGYDRNMGKGHALRYGAQFAQGQVTIMIDSDREIKLPDFPTYLQQLQHADMLIASKRHPKSIYKAPIMRKLLSTGFHILTEILTGIKTSDTQSGLKAIRTQELKRLLPLLSVKKYAFDIELIAVASLIKLRIGELPVEIHMGARFSLKHVVRMFVDLLGIAYRLRVKRWYQRNLHNRSARYKPLIEW